MCVCYFFLFSFFFLRFKPLKPFFTLYCVCVGVCVLVSPSCCWMEPNRLSIFGQWQFALRILRVCFSFFFVVPSILFYFLIHLFVSFCFFVFEQRSPNYYYMIVSHIMNRKMPTRMIAAACKIIIVYIYDFERSKFNWNSQIELFRANGNLTNTQCERIFCFLFSCLLSIE